MQKEIPLVIKRRLELSLAGKMVLSLGFTVATAFLAQVKFFLPFTPVPITGQTLGVYLSGIFCGGVFGSISQIFYVLFGTLGVPVFSASSANILISPTGGYILGFMVAPLVIGFYIEKKKASGFFSQIKAVILGAFVIYLFGVVALASFMKLDFSNAFLMGVLPFIPGEILKIILAGAISSAIFKKK